VPEIPASDEAVRLALDAAIDAAFAAEVEYARTREPDGGGHAMPSREQVQRLLEAAAPVLERDIRDLIAASLRRAAEGRREYAASAAGHDEIAEPLEMSARYYESAARIIEDPRHIMAVIPSWRWTEEESASLRNPPEVRGDLRHSAWVVA